MKHKSAFVMYSDLHNLQYGSSTKVEPGAISVLLMTGSHCYKTTCAFLWHGRKWKNWACPDHTGEETFNVSA